MLNKIKLKNFKSLKDQPIPLAPLTLLTGLNNSGKSSVIQAVRIFWKWAAGNDPTLKGHGPLKELKNEASDLRASMSIQCTFDKKQTAEMKVDFSEQVLINSPENILESLPLLSYVGADRLGPQVILPVYTAADTLTHVGEQGEFVIDFLSRYENALLPATLKHPLSEGDTLNYNVQGWLKEIAPDIKFQHTINRKRDTAFADIDGFRPPNVGFGLSYTLPVIVILLGMAAQWQEETDYTNKNEKGAIVLIENPEAHLHPRGQTAMGQLIALVAEEGIQVIVETHSDYVMDGIRIAVKEKKISTEKVCFHYFERIDEYETVITTPKISSDGKLDFWPEGFFDQTLKNRAKLAKRG